MTPETLFIIEVLVLVFMPPGSWTDGLSPKPNSDNAKIVANNLIPNRFLFNKFPSETRPLHQMIKFHHNFNLVELS